MGKVLWCVFISRLTGFFFRNRFLRIFHVVLFGVDSEPLEKCSNQSVSSLATQGGTKNKNETKKSCVNTTNMLKHLFPVTLSSGASYLCLLLVYSTLSAW